MYLPKKMLWFDLFMLLPAGIFIVLSFIKGFSPLVFVIALIQLAAGVLLPLCIKNQMLVMLPDDRFAYRTMFGNVYVYSFSEVRSILFETDSRKLLMPDGRKIHIERFAHRSERLSLRLARLYEDLRNKTLEEMKKWRDV